MSNTVCKPTDNLVIFEINKVLDKLDLETISLFLENKRQSGGGDIVRLEEDSPGAIRALKVEYEEAEAKQRVLARKFIKFQNYLLRVSEHGFKVNDLYELDNKRIILKNIDEQEEDFVVQMYAEFLLPDNTVIEITRMNYSASTFCVEYKDVIDFNVLNKRHEKRPNIRNRVTELKKAYKTFTLLITGQNIDVIQQKMSEGFPFLKQANKADTSQGLYLEKINNCILCQFEDANSECLGKGVLKKNNFVSDICYNFDFICEKELLSKKKALKGKKKLVNKSIQTDCGISSNKSKDETPTDQSTVKASINALSQKYEMQKMQESLVEKRNADIEPMKAYGCELEKKINPSSLLNTALVNCKSIFTDFKEKTKEFGEFITIGTLLHPEFKIECNSTKAEPITWSKQIETFIKDYENRLNEKRISIPPNLRHEKELDDLKKHLEFNFKLPNDTVVYEQANDSIVVKGYTAAVRAFADNVHSKFNNLENNILDRCKRKLDVKLDVGKFPAITILSNSNGFFLKEFSTQIAKCEALVELLNLEATKLNIKCLMTKNKCQKEQTVLKWRKNVDTCITNFFAKFKKSTLNLSFSQKNEERLKTHGFGDKMLVTWVNESSVEIIGLVKEVDNVVSNLTKAQCVLKDKLVNKKDLDKGTKIVKNSKQIDLSQSSLKTINPSEETFLISDLKWFQTRMLFEKKYFQFVSEVYKELEVMVDMDLTRIFYTGKNNDIDDAKQLAFDILEQILGIEVEATKAHLSKLTENETQLETIIKQNGLCCIVDSKSDNAKYTIYGTSPEEIAKCKFILGEIKF